MTSTITDTHRRVVITEVREIVVTQTLSDAGGFVRSIRILGEPVHSSGATEIMEIVVRSDDKEDLNLTAPSQHF